MLFACGRNWWCSWVSFFLSPSTHSHPSGCPVGLCIKDTRFDWVCCGAEGQSPYLSPRSSWGTSLTTVCESMFYIIWRQKMPILVWVVPKAGPDVRTWVTPGSKNNVESELGTNLGLPPWLFWEALGNTHQNLLLWSGAAKALVLWLFSPTG